MYDTDDKRKEYVISGSVSNNDIFNFSVQEAAVAAYTSTIPEDCKVSKGHLRQSVHSRFDWKAVIWHFPRRKWN